MLFPTQVCTKYWANPAMFSIIQGVGGGDQKYFTKDIIFGLSFHTSRKSKFLWNSWDNETEEEKLRHKEENSHDFPAVVCWSELH